jgi:hypothetical protein
VGDSPAKGSLAIVGLPDLAYSVRRQAGAVRLSTATSGARQTASVAPEPRDRARARSGAADQAVSPLKSTSKKRAATARPSSRVRIGVISDSHGYLDPEVLGAFSGVTHIVHAGDIGDRGVLAALAAIAPVTAVAGNLEPEELLASLPREAAGEVGGVRFVVAHKRKRLFKRLAAGKLPAGLDEVPDLVIYGHDHLPASSWVDGTLFLNPGTASAPDDEDDDPTVAVVEDTGSGLAVTFLPLRRREA